ncbi:MAG: hypothetical protein CMK59_03665 [Proteobacteria bacterium]|nr:hypothetical protein [Pseudomonadota bacterium]
MISRRRFLKTLGGAGLGLGTLGWRNALANFDEEAPKRLIIINHNHGWTYDTWKMHTQTLSSTTDWERDLWALDASQFSTALSPLYDHRHRLLALDGISLVTAELDMDGFRHETGWIQSWTGNWTSMTGSGFLSDDGLGAQSASLDQLVAAHISRTDRLPSIEIALNSIGETGRNICFGPNGQVLPLEDSPSRIWDRIFGPSIAPDPLLSRHKHALEFAFSEYKNLSPQLNNSAQSKLDAHFSLLNSLSGRLEGMAHLECPTVPSQQDGSMNYDEQFDAFSELIAAAFSCDATRVVTMSLGDLPTSDFGWDHYTDDVHKGLAHEVYNTPACHDAMTDYITVHAEQISRLIHLLESMPDGDGQTLMDNTLIVWGSELADGWHGYRHYCPLIIGGSWHFRTGRYLHWAHQTPAQILVPRSIEPGGYTLSSGLPHQHLLVSVAQAMGLETDYVGIKHVQSQNGDFIDCTGTLPNLL